MLEATSRVSFSLLRFPNITLIGREAKYRKWIQVNNITNMQWLETVGISELRSLAISNSVHLCPSVREGFGHYINEARANGALVITTNFAPMNEFVSDGVDGLLVDYLHYYKQEFQLLHRIKPLEVQVQSEDVCYVVEKVLLMSMEERKALGDAARIRFEEERDFMRRQWMAISKELELER